MPMLYDCEKVPTSINEDDTEITEPFDTIFQLDNCEVLKNYRVIMDNIIAENRELNDDEQIIIRSVIVKMQGFRKTLATYQRLLFCGCNFLT